MLIKNYILQDHKCINHTNFLKLKSSSSTSPTSPYTILINNVPHPTLRDNPLPTHKPHELRQLFAEQLTIIQKELELQLKYSLISSKSKTITLQQYKKYYVHTVNDTTYVFLKDDLLNNTTHDYKLANIIVNEPQDQQDIDEPPIIPEFIFNHDKSNLQTVGISVNSIRNITGFSYYTVPPWSTTDNRVFIEWQKQMIEDTSDVLVVNGSRQMGKSYGISELLIEESFIPGADILVAAFLQKTTNAILNYMRKFMKDFSEDDFQIFKKDGYIQNIHTGVCIHFRTLSDGGANVLGLTLRLIVVDEAQLISVEVFDDVLKPTLTTTGGRLVMIGTAIEDTDSYMFATITAIAKGIQYNNPGQSTARLITVSADNNPLIHPRVRQEINATRDTPSTQRQYFNVWGKLSDSLFQPIYIQPDEFFTHQNTPTTMTGYLIYGIDPARRADRSGWSATYVANGHATTIKSGEVPEHLKKDWENQATFHKENLNTLKQQFPFVTIKTVIDLTGLGDGVLAIFRLKELNIDFKVQYTAGTSSTQPIPTHYHVGKSLLINNVLDLTEGKRYKVIQPLNKLLEEEFKYVRLKETRTGMMGMTSAFFDDITNSAMIALFIAKTMNYLFRETSSLTPTQNYNMVTEDIKLRQSYIKNKTPQTSHSHF